MTDREILRSMGIVVTVNLASRYINISAHEGIDLGGLEGECEPGAGQEPHRVTVQTRMHAIAVELDFVEPVRTARRFGSPSWSASRARSLLSRASRSETRCFSCPISSNVAIFHFPSDLPTSAITRLRRNFVNRVQFAN